MRPGNIIRWQNLLFSFLLAALCLVIGWYSQQYYRQWDITAQARHSLNETSIAVLQMLDGPVNALAVMGPEKEQRDAVTALFDKFRKYKPDFHLEFLNPETSPNRVRQLNVSPGGEIILAFGEQEQRIRILSERSVTNALQRLARPVNRHVLFVTGHEERNPVSEANRDYAEISSRLAATGFSFDTISLVSQPVVPETADLLVIAAPLEKYFPGEVASILNYLSRGGNLLWLLEPGQGDTGLRALALELGIDALPGIVVDANTQLFNVDTPTFAVINEYAPNPVSADFSSITLFPEAVGLDVLPMQDRTILPLLQTSANSWTELGPIENEIAFDENTEERRGPLTLGVTINRDREIGKQRIAVIGDADFMANTWLGNGGNQAFAERLFNWLGTDDNMLEFNSETAPDKQVVIPAPALLTMAGVFLMG
ncbi:MAG: Gldg family protein, partial [Gammaproteobacteria bacterium]|nr:Gldg family protein [Gammaproteobacteria bacterium]